MNKVRKNFFFVIFAITILVIYTACNRERGNAKILDVYKVVKNCTPPYIVKFDCLIDSNFAGNMNYKWDFGDGTIIEEKSPEHVYKTSGVYTVTLTIQNYDRQDIKTMALDLQGESQSVKVDFDYITVNNNYMAPAEFHFINYTEFSSSFFWNFGDYKGSDEENPVHIYTEPGTYDVRLRADCNEDTSYMTGRITVEPPPSDLFIDEVYVWLPDDFTGIPVYLIVYYGIFTEIETDDYPISTSSFPLQWDLNEDLFFFNGSFTSDKIFFEVWDVDNNSGPIYTFFITSKEVQEMYYPESIFWDNGDYSAEVFLTYQ